MSIYAKAAGLFKAELPEKELLDRDDIPFPDIARNMQ